MKATCFYPNPGTCVVLLMLLLSTRSMQAQTFNARQGLTDTPMQLEANIYPLSNQPNSIRVNFNNRTSGGVRVMIRNEKGEIYYNEMEITALYRRSFDLSSMPMGTYTVELIKAKEHIARTFVIEPPVTSHITMLNQPDQQAPNLAAEKKVIVNY